MEFLVIDDDKTFRDATCYLIESEGHYGQPASNGQSALANLKENEFDAVLLDVNLGPESGLDLLPQILRAYPNLPVIIFTAQGTVHNAVEAMRGGALDYLEKPFTREQFHRVVARVQRFNQMSQSIERLEREVKETKSQSPELLLDFATPRMKEIMAVLEKAARTPASILLLGESGTGKSALARVVHQQSHLADQPLVTVSCPSLSKELLESELFGHTKGAFTGAVKDRWGKVKAAHGGTLFLDEIGDLPMEIQPKLLRLLQEKEYERLGENITRQAELRMIAATNRDLKKRMAEGMFREDLYFRLNVIAVEVPPLRAPAGGLGPFGGALLAAFCRAMRAQGGGLFQRGHGADQRLQLAGEPAGIAQRHRAGGDPEPGGQYRSAGLAAGRQRGRRHGQRGAGPSTRRPDLAGKAGGMPHPQGAGTHRQRGRSRPRPGH